MHRRGRLCLRRSLSFTFVLCCLFSYTWVSAQESKLAEVAKLFANIEERNAYVEALEPDFIDATTLPIGVKRTLGGMEVTVALTKLNFAKQKVTSGVFAKLVVPQGTGLQRKVLFFGAEGVPLSYSGGLADDLKLSLLHDVELPFVADYTKIVLKGNDLQKSTGQSASGTYVTVNCGGFKQLSLDAEVHFSHSLLVPAHPGNIAPSGELVGHFTCVLERWEDLMVEITIPDFQIRNLEGYTFSLGGVVLDLSDVHNAAGMQFPKGYSPDLPSHPELWRGIYAKDVTLTLPQAFSSASLSAHNLLIDEYGLSGFFEATNILSIDKGDANGWKFSVDKFAMEISANELVSTRFQGVICLPFRSEYGAIKYEGLLRENNEYTLIAHPSKQIELPFLKAKVVLDTASLVHLHLVNGKFVPEAILTGVMSIAGSGGDALPLNLPELRFQELRLTTEAPYISIKSLGTGQQTRIGEFPVSISDITLRTEGNRAILSAKLAVNVYQKYFSGNTGFELSAQYRNNEWQYQDFRLKELVVDAKISGMVHLKGALAWHRGDAIYGDGFTGDMALNIALAQTGASSFALKVKTGFGCKEDFRYWYADGLALFTPGIPIVGPFTLNGIGGALTSGVRSEQGGNTQDTFTGARYIPDSTIGLGFKATTVFEIAKAVRGQAAFEIQFTKAGGVARAGFYGYAEFPKRETGQAPPSRASLQESFSHTQEKEQNLSLAQRMTKEKGEYWKVANELASIPAQIKNSGISGTIGIQLNLQNHTLHANTALYVNTPSGFLEGLRADGAAGYGVLHISNERWYMHLGTPKERLGLRLKVGGARVECGSYFMAGADIPAIPTPPSVVTELLGSTTQQLQNERDLGLLSGGNGLAFGSEFRLNTGDLTFLMMYANFETGVGFDIMLKDYSQAVCKGRTGTIGLNGWYAQGQAYAYLQGELGVRVKLWALNSRVTVLKGGAAVLLQAGLPDPAYFKGYLAVKLNVLGLIKGSARFKLELGEECEVKMAGDSPLATAVINQLAPAEHETNVSVFAVPEATFNVNLGEYFQAKDTDGREREYRVQLKDFRVSTLDGENIAGKVQWNSEDRSAQFLSDEILPPQKQLRATVQVVFEEYKDSQWQMVYTSEHKPAIEEKSCTFTTGDAPDDIPKRNIAHSYPVMEQNFFYTGETHSGYIQLHKGQQYLFDRGYEYNLFFDSGKERVKADFKYNAAQNRLEFIIPQLRTQTSYTFSLGYKIKGGSIGHKPVRTAQRRIDEFINAEVGGKNAQADLSEELEKVILEYPFETSRFATLASKIQALKKVNAIVIQSDLSLNFSSLVNCEEPFDEAEILGNDFTGGRPLIKLRASLHESFFREEVFPLLYNDYPYNSSIRLERVKEGIEVAPYNAVYLNKSYLDAWAKQKKQLHTFPFPFMYCAATVASHDFQELLHKVINSREQVPTHIKQRFLDGGFTYPRYGKYLVKITYELPDGRTMSSADFTFFNLSTLNQR